MDTPCILFLSDFHLGVPNDEKSREREHRVVHIIKKHLANLDHLYLVGDVFDFWFEYKHVIPKGFLRLQGILAEVADKGIPITMFRGNHDIWMWDYFKKELNATIHSNALNIEHYGYKLHIHHGDGLGPGDKGYKFIKKIFHAPLFQWLFKWIHPDIGIGIANYFSATSSNKNREKDALFLGEKNEWIINYCQDILTKEKFDFLIFGHRHLPIKCDFINKKATYFNLGDWLVHDSYGVLTKNGFQLYSSNTSPVTCQVN